MKKSLSLVLCDKRHYRKIAQESWGLTDEQMKGMHVHHRIPRSEGGTNDPSNLYVCSPWFHAHVWHGEDSYYPMIEWATENGRKGGKVRAALGYRVSDETKAKMSETRLGLPKSPEHSLAISKAKKGKSPVWSEETMMILKQKCGQAASYPHSKTTCPHCGKTGGRNAMTRYHFNNCKHKT